MKGRIPRKPRKWGPYRVTCQACWQEGFRYPVPDCDWCRVRRMDKAARRANRLADRVSDRAA